MAIVTCEQGVALLMGHLPPARGFLGQKWGHRHGNIKATLRELSGTFSHQQRVSCQLERRSSE